MITICNMTGFTAIEQYSQANSKSFSKALYTIGLPFGLGFCEHTGQETVELSTVFLSLLFQK